MRGLASCCLAPSNHWAQFPRPAVLLACEGNSVSQGQDPVEEQWAVSNREEADVQECG